MQDIYFLSYNNYYNRQVKNDGDYLSAYEPYIIDSLLNTNFNPNDGITTTHVTGSWNYNTTPDYLLVFDAGTTSSPVSRWFVIEAVRTRLGQYQLSLVRDVISENYTSVLNSPCYIEKGWVPDTDPAIFNSEGVLVNQIKKSETKLYDYTNTAWIVGYLDSKYSNANPITGSFSPAAVDLNYSSITEVPFYHSIDNLQSLSPNTSSMPQYFIAGNSISADEVYYTITVDNFRGDNPPYIYVNTFTFYIFPDPSKNYVIQSTTQSNSIFTCRDRYPTELLASYGQDWSRMAVLLLQGGYSNSTNLGNASDREILDNLNEKEIFISDLNNTYSADVSIKTIESTNDKQFFILNNSTIGSFFTYNSSLLTGTYNIDNNTSIPTEQQIASLGFYAAPWVEYTFSLNTVSGENFSIPIAATRKKLSDAPYDMFAIPYDNFTFVANENVPTKVNKTDSLSIANLLALNLDANLYDIQLLPYCPITAIKQNLAGNFVLSDLTENGDYSYITKGNSINSVIFWATKASFTFNINYPIEVDDYKITNECDMWRLCSPNYNGVFEFNAAKNGGVPYFNVDCTYKPISPYIHINPAFGRLYGADYDDARGLICGGDFSLPVVKEAWISYQLQNKNYEKTFQRQIENMEVQHDVARIQERWNVATGTVSGAVSGATTGAIGGPIGAVAGGVVGGASSLAGGITDIRINEMLRNEALDYTKDMFNYNLENIKALPTSLAKVSAFTYNNKIVPFLEYYTCTNEEKEAIRNKIKYNGFTIMRTGAIKDYLKEDEETYVKAKLIRWISTNSEDFHYINYIAAELNKGVFITK